MAAAFLRNGRVVAPLVVVEVASIALALAGLAVVAAVSGQGSLQSGGTWRIIRGRLNISPLKVCLNMIFLFPWWDMDSFPEDFGSFLVHQGRIVWGLVVIPTEWGSFSSLWPKQHQYVFHPDSCSPLFRGLMLSSHRRNWYPQLKVYWSL